MPRNTRATAAGAKYGLRKNPKAKLLEGLTDEPKKPRRPSSSSSPISRDLADDHILDLFLEYVRERSAGTSRADVWARTIDIIKTKDWSLSDLKSMGEEPMYKRALEAGILEGTARRMREELRKYKQHYQATEAAKTLAGAATRY